jgi:hypothetical protein
MLDILTNLDLSPLVNGASKILESDVSRMTTAFLIAAYLHRGWVKKDMSEQFSKLTEAIEHVAVVMSKRMDGLDERVVRLEDKISNKVNATKE